MELLVILVIVAIALLLGGAWALGRRPGGMKKREPHPHSPEYHQAIENLEELKRGTHWGDLPDEGPLQ